MQGLSTGLQRFSVNFCMIFGSIMTNIINSDMFNYVQMVIMYAFRESLGLNIVIALFSIILSNLIFFGIFYSFAAIIACCQPNLANVRSFVFHFRWLFAAIVMFDTFVPVVPSSLLIIAFAIIGLPLPQYIFVAIQTSLPDMYIRYLWSKDLPQLVEMKFVVDDFYPILVLYSIGLVLIAVLYSLYRLYETMPATEYVELKKDTPKEEKEETKPESESNEKAKQD